MKRNFKRAEKKRTNIAAFEIWNASMLAGAWRAESGGRTEGGGGRGRGQYKLALVKEKSSIIHVVLAVVCR